MDLERDDWIASVAVGQERLVANRDAACRCCRSTAAATAPRTPTTSDGCNGVFSTQARNSGAPDVPETRDVPEATDTPDPRLLARRFVDFARYVLDEREASGNVRGIESERNRFALHVENAAFAQKALQEIIRGDIET